LGLALVQRLVDMHGGSIQVESVLGQGSRFLVVLPYQHGETAPQDETTAIPTQIQQSLIVEDSGLDADRLSRFLKLLGIHSTIKNTGVGVVEKAATLKPDVILLDINLPDVTGWDVLKKLKQNAVTSEIPVVITSVLENYELANQLGAAGYLVKLFTLDDLQRTLARLPSPKGKNQDTALVVSPEVHYGTIMVVDDNETNVVMIEDYLRAKKYNVFSASSGIQFLNQVSEIRPDLVLMDIQMPDMDGLETIRRLRLLPDPGLDSVPVIAITALAMPGDRESCLEAGANEYLSKPIRLRELVSVIQNMLSDRDDDHE
jgi:CheY-like chemotaxis protein